MLVLLLREFVERNTDHVQDLYEASLKIGKSVNELDRLIDKLKYSSDDTVL